MGSRTNSRSIPFLEIDQGPKVKKNKPKTPKTNSNPLVCVCEIKNMLKKSEYDGLADYRYKYQEKPTVDVWMPEHKRYERCLITKRDNHQFELELDNKKFKLFGGHFRFRFIREKFEEKKEEVKKEEKP